VTTAGWLRDGDGGGGGGQKTSLTSLTHSLTQLAASRSSGSLMTDDDTPGGCWLGWTGVWCVPVSGAQEFPIFPFPQNGPWHFPLFSFQSRTGKASHRLIPARFPVGACFHHSARPSAAWASAVWTPLPLPSTPGRARISRPKHLGRAHGGQDRLGLDCSWKTEPQERQPGVGWLVRWLVGWIGNKRMPFFVLFVWLLVVIFCQRKKKENVRFQPSDNGKVTEPTWHFRQQSARHTHTQTNKLISDDGQGVCVCI
jgi:hypothetical protein